jgi:hypothetical protein
MRGSLLDASNPEDCWERMKSSLLDASNPEGGILHYLPKRRRNSLTNSSLMASGSTDTPRMQLHEGHE